MRRRGRAGGPAGASGSRGGLRTAGADPRSADPRSADPRSGDRGSRDRRSEDPPVGVASLWRLPGEERSAEDRRRAWLSRHRPAVLAAAGGLAALTGWIVTAAALRRRKR
ncbi:hypothetical protein GCM10018955_11500 [Planomonospora venezuelensis]